LNKDYKGGRTTVDNYTVEPETGKIILFDSGIRHKVSPLIEGERYVILVWYNLIKREEL
jgi:predicted 2-oxoglutarate/Fe(II)-dependent dioxygenase YbiX